MKKLFALLLIVPFLWTCKKGEKDPLISLRTRKARLVGEWTMKRGIASITITEPGKTLLNQTFMMDGRDATINEKEVGVAPVTYLIKYTLYIEFRKDGTFTFSENFGGYILQAWGTWNFMGRIGEDKNKESIVLRIDKADKGYTRNNLFNKIGTEVIYKISELKNKTLVMKSSSKPYNEANGEYADFTCEYLFEQR